VRKAGAELRAKLPKIDVLVNNAGVIMGKRELTVDDVRGNLCKRCETKPLEIEYCLKLIPKPYDPRKKVQDPPTEDKARISYECEKCGVKAEFEDKVVHKADCKPAFGSGTKKVCAKSGKMPHATKVD